MTPVQAIIIWTLLFTAVGMVDYRRSLRRPASRRQPGWGHVALYLVTLPFVALIERAREWFVA